MKTAVELQKRYLVFINRDKVLLSAPQPHEAALCTVGVGRCSAPQPGPALRSQYQGTENRHWVSEGDTQEACPSSDLPSFLRPQGDVVYQRMPSFCFIYMGKKSYKGIQISYI